MKDKTGPVLGVILFVLMGLGMIALGVKHFFSNGNFISFIGFGVLNLVLAICFYNGFIARSAHRRKTPIMRERLYGPSGDKKPIIHQKLPPL